MIRRYTPKKHERRSIRLKGYDYAPAGAYFVTICTQKRECVFGDVVDRAMRLNKAGRICAETWLWLGNQYPYVELEEWIVMPNHVHGILVITDENYGGEGTGGSRGTGGGGGSRTALTTAPGTSAGKRKPLGRLIGAFKTVSTKRMNQMRGTPGAVIWQRGYYEHIIRDATALERIREYITENPARWADDRENQLRRGCAS